MSPLLLDVAAILEQALRGLYEFSPWLRRMGLFAKSLPQTSFKTTSI